MTTQKDSVSPKPAKEAAINVPPEKKATPTSSDTDKAADDIEVVEAEIVDPLPDEKPPVLDRADAADTGAGAKTTDQAPENNAGPAVSKGAEDAKPVSRFITPGVILIGMFALGLVGVLLSNGTAPRNEQPTNIQPKVAEREDLDAGVTRGSRDPQSAATAGPLDEGPEETVDRATQAQSAQPQPGKSTVSVPQETITPNTAPEKTPPVNDAAAERTVPGSDTTDIPLAHTQREADDATNVAEASKSPEDGQDAQHLQTQDPQAGARDTARRNTPPQDANAQGADTQTGAPQNTQGTTPRSIGGPSPRVTPPALLSNTPAEEPVTASEIEDIKADVQAEIDALKEQLEEQEKKSEQQIANLETRLTTAKSDEVAKATRQATISIALNNLQRQLATGRSFEDQLDVLGKLVPGNINIERLKDYAKDGLATDTTLKGEFDKASIDALAEANRERADGLWAKFMANISGLFSVRRIGDIPGDTPSAIISRAEMRLIEGDISAAVSEIENLDGRAEGAMADWLVDARARVIAETLINEFSNNILLDL